jgi:hypothetical protein
MRISTALTSVLLLTSLVLGTCSQAKADSTETTQRAVAEEDYNMYVRASGGAPIGVPANDALHDKFMLERKVYLGGKTLPTVQTTVITTPNNDEMKIQSFKDYDYNMYVRATGGFSNPEVHTRFNTERNVYLGIKKPNTVVPVATPVDETEVKPEVKPTVSTPAVEPKPVVNVNKVTKPSKRIATPTPKKKVKVVAPVTKNGKGNVKMIKIIYFK